MSFKVTLTISFLSIFLSSCAFLGNPSEVMVTIDSEPLGAKVYVDGEYKGDTTRQIYLVPNKNYNLQLVKDGYQTVNEIMKTKLSFRTQRNIDRRRCKSDMIFSPLILPFFSLISDKCRDFEKKVYFIEMPKIEVPKAEIPIDINDQNDQSYVPKENMEKQHNDAAAYYTVTPKSTEPTSASYNDPYQNYYNPENIVKQDGEKSVKKQITKDNDGGEHRTTIYYNQNYQPVPSQTKQKSSHIY